MIEVLPADNQTAEALARKLGVDMPIRAMCMSRNGEDLGYVLYRIDRDTMHLVSLFSKEEPLEELLVRAALNDAVNALAITAVCRERAHYPLLKRLGFGEEEDGCSIFIPDFFMRPCSGCHGG